MILASNMHVQVHARAVTGSTSSLGPCVGDLTILETEAINYYLPSQHQMATPLDDDVGHRFYRISMELTFADLCEAKTACRP